MQLFFDCHAQLVAFLTLLLPPALIGLLHAIYYIKGAFHAQHGLEERFSADGGRPATGITVLIPIKDEPKDLVLGIIRNLDSLKNELGSEAVIAIVCDDPPEKAEKLKEEVEALAKELELNVLFMIREGRGGGRAAALNWALERLNAEVIIVLDVDSRPGKGYFSTLVSCVRKGYAACVGRWEGYWLTPTKLALSVSRSMKFLVDTLYRGRFAVGSFIYPLGSGTAFDVRALRGVGFWEEGVIQDDMHIGTKLFGRGYRVGYADNAVLRILVPSKYLALKIQQRRWAYGAMDALIRGFKYLRRAPYSTLCKLEATFFLMQYIPQALLGITLLVVPATSVFLHYDIMSLGLVPAAILTALLGVYGYAYYLSLRESGLSVAEAVKVLGSSTAMTVSLSFSVLLGTLAALLRARSPTGVTPKGESEHRLRGGYRTELALLSYLLCTLLVNALSGNVATATWTALLATALAYIVLNSEKIVKAPISLV